MGHAKPLVRWTARRSVDGRSSLHSEGLDTLSNSVEDTIPDASLLAVVATRLAETVVKVVILNGEFHIESLQPPQDGVRPVRANSRVSEHLNVLREVG